MDIPASAAPGEVAIERNKVRVDFYRVGEWSKEVAHRLSRDHGLFPLLSRESPRLLSSTGNAPYPMALIREFDELTEIACENSKRRLGALTESMPSVLSASRTPAGLGNPDPAQAGAEKFGRRLKTFLSSRCSGS